MSTDDAPSELGPDERALARTLDEHRPEPRPGLRHRVRRVVGSALHRRVLRRRSAALLAVGWAGLALAAALALAAPPG